jgi:hypothetical protein
LKITQMQRQLMMLQLKRGGAPVSWLTVFKNMDIPNPEKEIEDSFKEEAKLQKMKMLAQLDIMKTLKEMGVDPAMLMGGGEGGGGGGKKGGGGGGGGGGPTTDGDRKGRASRPRAGPGENPEPW